MKIFTFFSQSLVHEKHAAPTAVIKSTIKKQLSPEKKPLACLPLAGMRKSPK